MTYSLNIKGVRADNPPQIQSFTVSDPQGVAGGQSLAMQQGAHFLVKRPDGSERYFRIDAERSIPGQPPVLIASGNH